MAKPTIQEKLKKRLLTEAILPEVIEYVPKLEAAMAEYWQSHVLPVDARFAFTVTEHEGAIYFVPGYFDKDHRFHQFKIEERSSFALLELVSMLISKI